MVSRTFGPTQKFSQLKGDGKGAGEGADENEGENTSEGVSKSVTFVLINSHHIHPPKTLAETKV